MRFHPEVGMYHTTLPPGSREGTTLLNLTANLLGQQQLGRLYLTEYGERIHRRVDARFRSGASWRCRALRELADVFRDI